MEVNGLYNIFGIVRVFICLLLIIFLITLKSNRALSNKLFALFLSLLIIDFNGNWIIDIFKNDLPNFDMFRNTLAFLQVPVFYLYVNSICYSNFKLKYSHLLHCIPLVIVNLILLPNYYLVIPSLKVEFLNNILDRPEIIFIYIFIHILVIGYITALFFTLKKFRIIYLENYTDTNRNGFKWLLNLTILISIVYILALGKNILKFQNVDISFIWIKLIFGLVLLAAICWYLMLALKNPQIFRGVNIKLKSVGQIMSGETLNSSIRDGNKNLDQLFNYMKREKPFLEPNLTVQNLADRLNLSEKDLSILINHNLGKHFFDFINGFRIKNSMEMLKDPTKKEHTILEILYQSGFNSKSSFNTAFKKQTGLTPSEYRKRNLP